MGGKLPFLLWDYCTNFKVDARSQEEQNTYIFKYSCELFFLKQVWLEVFCLINVKRNVSMDNSPAYILFT